MPSALRGKNHDVFGEGEALHSERRNKEIGFNPSSET
jgi:hypothetical protein